MGSASEFVFPTEAQKVLIRKAAGTSEADIGQALTIVRDWLELQPHLPKVIDDGRLERMYISSKCRVEKLKRMVDAYYTLKTKFPYFLTNRDPLGDDVKSVVNFAKFATMRKLTPEYHRVGVLTGVSPDHTIMDPVKAMKHCLMDLQLIVKYDYSIGYVLVLDVKNFTPSHIVKLSVRDLKALELIARNVFSKKIKGIHFINAPKVMNMLLMIVKPALPEKMVNRITVHEPNTETIFEHVPRDLLPVDVGGTGPSIDELMHEQYKLAVENRDWFLEEDKYVADESKRPLENSYEYNLFGVDGSFKKLQVD